MILKNLEKYAAILQKICSVSIPGKKKVQKLMYLMERKGADLSLDYSIHFYGPYSEKLDEALHILEAQGIAQIDTSESTHTIRVSKEQDEEVIMKEMSIVQNVLDSFGNDSAFDLEAITTLDYAANSLLHGRGTDEEIIDEVKKIKGRKFSDCQLKRDLQLLHNQNFLPKAAPQS